MEQKRHYADIYGFAVLPPDWRDNMDNWYDRQDEITDELAERLQEFLDFDLEGFFSESRNGNCFDGKDEAGNTVLMYPNFVGDKDDSWQEPNYKTFPLILELLSSELDYLKALEQRFADAPGFRIVLLQRETYVSGEVKPPDILFALPPTTPEDDAVAVEPPSNDNETAS